MKNSPSDHEKMLLTFQIQDRLYSFGRAVDSKNFTKLSDVFAEDATGDYGSGRSHIGRGELIKSMEKYLGEGSNCGPSQHNILNVQVFIDLDGTLKSKSNFYAVHEGVGKLRSHFWKTWGEYNDTWRETSEGLRIQHRHYVTFFSEGPGNIVGRD